MTNLTQQLEDKKKGCNKPFKLTDKTRSGYGSTVYCHTYCLCPRCKEIIAILKQAIAEMQKQRQEILDLIKFNCIYRQRGLSIDIEEAENNFNAMGREYFRGMKQSYNDLQNKLEDIKYLISAVNTKYLSEEEMKEFEKLNQQLNQPKTEKENSKQ